jgi:ribose transport system substrate-binding protein
MRTFPRPLLLPDRSVTLRHNRTPQSLWGHGAVKRTRIGHLGVAVAISGLLLPSGCRLSKPRTIAAIPQTSGFSFWEAEHAGAEAAASKTGYDLYWNAPTRDDDVERQIQIVDRAVREGDKGLVLAPDQSLAFITPVRRALAKGVYTVIVGSPLSIPAGKGLSYILNDDQKTGEIVARRMGKILEGKGHVAIMGIDPNLIANLEQVRAFEETLERLFPRIRVVERRPRSYNAAEAVQVAAEILRARPDLGGIWALTPLEAGGAYVALRTSHKAEQVTLVACQQDLDLIAHIRRGQMDSVVIEDTYQMGYQAVMLIAREAKGQAVPAETKLEPTLVTRENVDSPEVQRQFSLKWDYRN